MEGIMSRDEWNAMVPILQSRLSEKERMVLELKYQSGFNFRQIGDLLRVSRSDTQATHTRAINKVRGALKGKRALFSR
jgi:RNA polymerase sigma factor (sigma-70 family)